jgi:hypothetical protein
MSTEEGMRLAAAGYEDKIKEKELSLSALAIEVEQFKDEIRQIKEYLRRLTVREADHGLYPHD